MSVSTHSTSLHYHTRHTQALGPLSALFTSQLYQHRIPLGSLLESESPLKADPFKLKEWLLHPSSNILSKVIQLDILLAHLLLPVYPQVQLIQDASVIHHSHYQPLVLVYSIQEHIDIDLYHPRVRLTSYYPSLLPLHYQSHIDRPAGTLQRRK